MMEAMESTTTTTFFYMYLHMQYIEGKQAVPQHVFNSL